MHDATDDTYLPERCDVINDDNVGVEVYDAINLRWEDVCKINTGVVEGLVESLTDWTWDAASHAILVETVYYEIKIRKRIGDGRKNRRFVTSGEEMESEIVRTCCVLEDRMHGSHRSTKVIGVESHGNVNSSAIIIHSPVDAREGNIAVVCISESRSFMEKQRIGRIIVGCFLCSNIRTDCRYSWNYEENKGKMRQVAIRMVEDGHPAFARTTNVKRKLYRTNGLRHLSQTINRRWNGGRRRRKKRKREWWYVVDLNLAMYTMVCEINGECFHGDRIYWKDCMLTWMCNFGELVGEKVRIGERSGGEWWYVIKINKD